MLSVCSERNSYRINSTLQDQRKLRRKHGGIKKGGISCDSINCLPKLMAQAQAAAREEDRVEVITQDPTSQPTPLASSNHNRPSSTTTPTFTSSLAPSASQSEVASAASSEKPSVDPSLSPSSPPIGSSSAPAHSVSPSKAPYIASSKQPSLWPSAEPVALPTYSFSQEPSLDHSLSPSYPETGSSLTISLTPSENPSLSTLPSWSPVIAAPTMAFQSTLIACNVDFEAVVEIQYKFVMEYEKNYEASTIIAALEVGMNAYIASGLIPCASSNNNRELTDFILQRREFRKEEVGIVKIDSKPEDTISITEFCATSEDINSCHVVEGSLKVYLGPTADDDIAILKVQLAIRQYLNSVQAIKGLFKTNYLSPKIIIPNEIESDNTDRSDGFTVQNGLSSRSITLFALAGVALMFSVVLAYNFRSSRMTHNSYIPPSPETNEIKTTSLRIDPTATRSSGEEEEEEELSPFSRMLPAAYRLDDGQDEMSVILELNESTGSAKSASLIMSEGYSDDETIDDIDLSVMNIPRVSQAPVLGAKRRRDGKNTGVGV